MHKFTFVLHGMMLGEFAFFSTSESRIARAYWATMESSTSCVFCEWCTPDGKIENVFDQ